MRALIDGLEREMGGWLELTRTIAKFRRAYFEALVEQGFGADQALFLVSQGGTPLDHIFGKK